MELEKRRISESPLSVLNFMPPEKKNFQEEEEEEREEEEFGNSTSCNLTQVTKRRQLFYSSMNFNSISSLLVIFLFFTISLLPHPSSSSSAGETSISAPSSPHLDHLNPSSAISSSSRKGREVNFNLMDLMVNDGTEQEGDSTTELVVPGEEEKDEAMDLFAYLKGPLIVIAIIVIVSLCLFFMYIFKYRTPPSRRPSMAPV